jgi:two-component system nitrate/nitrite response regulator NarL
MKIYLIDDHQLFRDGMSSLLESHGIQTTNCESPQKGIKEVQKVQVDAILLDLRMPEISGLEVLKIIKKNQVKTPVIMLTTSNSERDLKNCLEAGAQGYLLKDMNPVKLVEALKEAMSGSIVVADEMTPILAKFIKQELSENEFDKLTKREQEVACSLVNGSSNKVIARDLGISDGTVKLHVKSILKKLELNSRVEIAVLMSENNYCEELL